MTSPEIIFNQSLEVGGPAWVDSPYSTEPVADYSQTVWTALDFLVSVQPNTTYEGAVERPQTVTTYVLITPPGTDIPDLAAESRVRLGGVMVLDVVGEPERWPDPWNPGQVHHLEAIVEVVHG